MLARAHPVAERLVTGRPLMVEVGVFTGHMAEWLLNRRPDLRWIGIDNWLPTEEQPQAYIDTGDVHAAASAHQQAKWEQEARTRMERFEDRAVLIKEASPFAAHRFGQESVDMVFLDADHSKQGVLADCRAWWPIVKRGGYLGGHDFLNSDRRFTFGVNLAVEQFSNEVLVAYDLDDGTTWFMRKPAPIP
jgi:predicted O-methyltransferase YrrM